MLFLRGLDLPVSCMHPLGGACISGSLLEEGWESFPFKTYAQPERGVIKVNTYICHRGFPDCRCWIPRFGTGLGPRIVKVVFTTEPGSRH